MIKESMTRNLPDRPRSAPKGGRPSTRSPDGRELHAVLMELAAARGRLEDLWADDDGSFGERVALLQTLQALRADAARLRQLIL